MRVMALVAGLLLAGCAADTGTGSASVYVKDAPADDFDEIHVVFTEVRVHATGGEAAEEPTGTTTGATTATNGTATDGGTGPLGAGWHTIVSSSGIDVDLLNASGTRAAFLGEADMPAGTYTQLRIVVSEAYGVKDNETVPIFVPSGVLRLNHPFTVEADQESRLVLDFDLESSLRENPQGWRLTPVVGSVQVETVADAESGAEVHDEGEVTET